jgi:hypothetical protein
MYHGVQVHVQCIPTINWASRSSKAQIATKKSVFFCNSLSFRRSQHCYLTVFSIPSLVEFLLSVKIEPCTLRFTYMLNAFSLPIELLAQVIGCDMFLILTFWRTSKNSSYICFIIFLFLHIFAVSNIVACCDILEHPQWSSPFFST